MPEKTTKPGRKPAKKPKPEVVEQIPLLDLHPFPDHPFQVRDDDAMQETAESTQGSSGRNIQYENGQNHLCHRSPFQQREQGHLR